MFSYADTPMGRKFAGLNLADSAYHEQPPSTWPVLGEGRFQLFRTPTPISTAITLGNLRAPDGANLGTLGEAGSGIPEKVRGAVFRTSVSPRKIPGIQTFHRFLFMSEPALQAWLAADARAIAHHPLDFQFGDGSTPSPSLHIVDVTRVIDGVDLERTYFHLRGVGEGRFALHDWGPMAIRGDIPSDVHAFRDSSFPPQIFVSAELAAALTKAKIKGWQVKDPADHYRLRAHLAKLYQS